MSAAQYAGLIGKYVRMERPATEEEWALEQVSTIGMEGEICAVWDTPEGVAVVADYGMGYVIREGEKWQIWAFDCAANARVFLKGRG